MIRVTAAVLFVRKNVQVPGYDDPVPHLHLSFILNLNDKRSWVADHLYVRFCSSRNYFYNLTMKTVGI